MELEGAIFVMINKEQAHSYFLKLTQNIDSSDLQKYGEAFREYMKYLAENYDDLDGEMKELYNKTFNSLLEEAKENLDKSIDSVEKRKGIRLYKIAKRDHFDINELVQILEKPKQDSDDIYYYSRVIFKKRMQNILDFLSDAAEHLQKYTTNSYAIIQLYYISIDELLAAFHLSQHSYVNQANAHIRTVLENLDKIELFNKQPKWADLWVSEDPKDKREKWKQLKPGAIRIKLGKKNEYNDLYSMLSELGTHSEIKSVQTRSIVEEKLNEKGNVTLQLWIGGCPYKHNIVFTISFLLYAVSFTLFSIANVLGEFLLESEVKSVLMELIEDIKMYNMRHFIPWAADTNFDITPLLEMLKRPLWDG